MTTTLTLRALTRDDEPFLGLLLYTALLWRPEDPRPPLELVLAHPEGAIFHREWGREGDTGIVAQAGGEPIGGVWYRFFTEEVHGHGYVDPETPELAIAVLEGHRGAGIGRTLMQAIHDRARKDGIARISLSVDPDNPARRLYESLAYRDVEPVDHRGRMLVELT